MGGALSLSFSRRANGFATSLISKQPGHRYTEQRVPQEHADDRQHCKRDEDALDDAWERVRYRYESNQPPQHSEKDDEQYQVK